MFIFCLFCAVRFCVTQIIDTDDANSFFYRFFDMTFFLITMQIFACYNDQILYFDRERMLEGPNCHSFFEIFRGGEVKEF